MIKTGCTNPDILASLSHLAHGDKVLITTGNFRFDRYGKAKVVYVGVRPGLPTTLQVAEALKETVNFERMELMATDQDTPTYTALKALFPDIPVEYYERFAYYDVTQDDDVALVIVTGDVQYAANVLLTIYL